MKVILYVLPGWLRVYEQSRGNIVFIAQYRNDAPGVTGLEQYINSLVMNTSVTTVVDLPGDAISRVRIPRIGRRQRKQVFDRLIKRELGTRQYCTAQLSADKTVTEARLFVLGETWERTGWCALLQYCEKPLIRIIPASLLSELAYQNLIQQHSHVLLCTVVGDSHLRCSYFKNGELWFTRLSDCEIANAAAIAEQVKTTQRYVENEHALDDPESLVVKAISDTPGDTFSTSIRTVLSVFLNPSIAAVCNTLKNYSRCSHLVTLLSRRFQISAIDCTSVDMYRRQVLKLRIRLARRVTNVATVVQFTLSAALLIFAALLEMERREYQVIASAKRAGVTELNKELRAGENAQVMRDAVVLSRFINQNSVKSVDLMGRIADLLSSHQSLILRNLAWRVNSLDSLNRQVMPVNLEEHVEPDPVMIRIAGLIDLDNSTLSAGYALYEAMLIDIRSVGHFVLEAEEQTPFDVGSAGDASRYSMSSGRNEFSIVLSYHRGNT